MRDALACPRCCGRGMAVCGQRAPGLGPGYREAVAAGRPGLGAHVGPDARGEVGRSARAPPGSGRTASWTLKTWGGGRLQRRGREEEPCREAGRGT